MTYQFSNFEWTWTKRGPAACVTAMQAALFEPYDPADPAASDTIRDFEKPSCKTTEQIPKILEYSLPSSENNHSPFIK